MSPIVPSLKGTRDFYPQDMAVRTWLYDNVRQVSESFGYQEYDAPFLETIDLYAAKSGEELVKEQSFVFPDRGGDLITLRPELTPSLARMVAQRQRQLTFPLRWWSWGPFWRYERPQKGRTREFFQWNIDMIGAESPEADAELVTIAASFLQRVGLSASQVRLLVNNRRLMDAELAALDIPQGRHAAIFRVIDRRDKMHPPEWEQYALSAGLSPAQLEGLIGLLGDQDLWQRSEEMRRFFAGVEALGMGSYVHYAPHIIRGLDYYTGTVFEAWDQDGEFRAILGGGRYDNLVSDVGGEPLRSVGFAMGDLVMSLALAKFGCLPENLSASPASVLITVFDEVMLPAALRLSRELREAGLNVAVYPEVAKLGKQFKYADRAGIPLAIVLGPNEQAQGGVSIKDLRTGEQRTVPQSGLASAVRSHLGQHG